MAFSTDSDLTALLPDILTLGISSFTDEHARAQADIEREIRNKWWDKTGFSGELNTALLTDSQWTRAAAYLVLWRYALPQLTNWVDGDRFQNMIEFYRARYSEEMDAIFRDGVEYDADNDSTVTNTEKQPRYSGRLFR
jgi:hypothetical protein